MFWSSMDVSCMYLLQKLQIWYLSSYKCLISNSDHVPCASGEVRCRRWAVISWDHVLQQLSVSSIFAISHYSYRRISKFFLITTCKGKNLAFWCLSIFIHNNFYRQELFLYLQSTSIHFLVILILSFVMGIALNFTMFLCTIVNSALTTTIVGVLKGVGSTVRMNYFLVVD